jgi:hypothetical protein
MKNRINVGLPGAMIVRWQLLFNLNSPTKNFKRASYRHNRPCWLYPLLLNAELNYFKHVAHRSLPDIIKSASCVTHARHDTSFSGRLVVIQRSFLNARGRNSGLPWYSHEKRVTASAQNQLLGLSQILLSPILSMALLMLLYRTNYLHAFQNRLSSSLVTMWLNHIGYGIG